MKFGYDPEKRQRAAVKIIRMDHPEMNPRHLAAEAQSLKTLNHPNILTFIEYIAEGDYIKKNDETYKVAAFVLEWAPNGDLFDLISHGTRFNEPMSRTIFQKLVEVIEYCHSMQIAHRDLKPENILFDENCNIKLADFGFSTAFTGTTYDRNCNCYLGTESYMSPELHEKVPYSPIQADLYALAVILFVIYAGSPPCKKAEPNDPYYKIFNSKLDLFWKAHERNKPKIDGKNYFSEEFRSLMTAMIHRDSTKRPSLEDIKASAWYNGPKATIEEVQKEIKKIREEIFAEGHFDMDDGDWIEVEEPQEEAKTEVVGSLSEVAEHHKESTGRKSAMYTKKESASSRHSLNEEETPHKKVIIVEPIHERDSIHKKVSIMEPIQERDSIHQRVSIVEPIYEDSESNGKGSNKKDNVHHDRDSFHHGRDSFHHGRDSFHHGRDSFHHSHHHGLHHSHHHSHHHHGHYNIFSHLHGRGVFLHHHGRGSIHHKKDSSHKRDSLQWIDATEGHSPHKVASPKRRHQRSKTQVLCKLKLERQFVRTTAIYIVLIFIFLQGHVYNDDTNVNSGSKLELFPKKLDFSAEKAQADGGKEAIFSKILAASKDSQMEATARAKLTRSKTIEF